MSSILPINASVLSLETLFYIFYCMPRDVYQVRVMYELIHREWRYHKKLQLWFATNRSTIHVVPGKYIYFDINVWEVKEYRGLKSAFTTEGWLSATESAMWL